MRCAIYSRYSIETQSPRSLVDQISECQSLAKQKGWIVLPAHIYQDAAVSGSDVNRTAYGDLKRAALNREFDCILVDDLSRLGRDMAESASIFRDLSNIGARIVSVSDGIDTNNPAAKIPFYFKGIMNEMFLDDLKAKVIRGLKGQVLRGYSAGGRVYGYNTKQILDPSGATDKFGRPKRIGCEITIYQEQARIVQEIFNLSKSGFGCRSIAESLNQRKVPSPHASVAGRSGYWGRGTVYSILHQRKYLGDWTWNKSKWLNRTQSGKRIKQKRPESEWVHHQDEELRIVSDELWQSVHPGNTTRTRVSSGRRSIYPLSGVLKCSYCGASLVVQNSGKYSCYMCNGYRNGGRTVCSNNRRILRDPLEKSFFAELNLAFMNPTILQQVKEKAENALKARLADWRQSFESARSRKRDLSRQLDNLMKFVEDGDSSPAIRERIAQKEAELVSAEALLERGSRHRCLDHNISVEYLERHLGQLATLFKQNKRYTVRLKQEIKNLFPDGLAAVQEEVDEGTLFQINGTARPFSSALLPTSKMSHSGTGNRTPA
ncbi:MAG: recombinase family protein [bacterium]